MGESFSGDEYVCNLTWNCNGGCGKRGSTLKHEGSGESIDGTNLSDKILQTTDCVSCSVKGHCSSAESKEKIIDITDASASSYEVGQSVMVVGQMSMGMKAVFWAFVLPFLIILTSLFVCMAIFNDELYAGCISLSLLLHYYFFLWLNKARFKQKFSFTIKPIK